MEFLHYDLAVLLREIRKQNPQFVENTSTTLTTIMMGVDELIAVDATVKHAGNSYLVYARLTLSYV